MMYDDDAPGMGEYEEGLQDPPAPAGSIAAQWWIVVDKNGAASGDLFYARESADEMRGLWDKNDPQVAPHRVIGLAEVEA